MRESLFSPLWYRVAEQVPRLGPDVVVRPQPSRGQPWYVLLSASGTRQCRVNRGAYQLVGGFDGKHTVQQIWDRLLQELRDDAPTQDEVIQIMARLSGQGFLDYGEGPDIDVQSRRRTRRASQRRLANINPLAFRVPLGDPTWLLLRLDGLRAFLFRPAMLWLWLVGIALGAAAAVSNWGLLSAHAVATVGTPRFLFLAWVLFPFIKLIHELGHALAVRHWGGEVHEAGISLFVLTPAPYVDASASSGFPKRSQRAAVAGMGVMVELALAALALGVWLNVQPGLVREVSFVILFVASVSTVLYNANPLLTFDGYYVLCDALDLPNLGTRSRLYWLKLLQRCVYGDERVVPLDAAPGERKWLVAYAPLSACYRVFVSGLIVLWAGHYSLVLGILMAVYAVLMVLLLPAIRFIRRVLSMAPLAAGGWRARSVLSAAAVGLVLLLFVVPLPFRTAAWGVVWLPEQAHVRTGTDGYISEFAVRDGQEVTRGQLLVKMQDPQLLTKRAVLSSEFEQLRSERFDILLRDSLKALNLQSELDRVAGELRRMDERIAQLDVHSESEGILVMPKQQDMQDSFVRRGVTLGYVLNRSEIGLRAAVPERDAALIRSGRGDVTVRLADSIGESVVAARVREVPAAGFELPGAALGDRGGGPYQTDPADKEGLRSIEPVVLIDLFLPLKMLERAGGRAWVVFDHGAQPLAVQLYRRLRQLFLQHFSPAG